MSEEYDDEGDGEGGSNEYAFDEETEGVLVAGKSFELSGMTREALGAFAAHVDALAQKHGHGLSVVPAGDLSDNSGPGADEDLYTVAHVGFVGGRGGTYGPALVSRSGAMDALEKARAVPDEVWAAVAEKLTGRERESFEEAEVALHFTCVGPLAAATLVFGVPGTKDEEGKGQYVYGQDMDQEPHEDGVWGKKIAYAQYEGPESDEVDLSDSAHEQYEKELDVPGAQYYIVARYD